MKYLRTFIALPLRVNKHFLLVRDELMQKLAAESISWVDPERYHVTLRFLGDTEQGTLEDVRAILRNRVSVPGKTMLRMGKTGSFGPRKKPGVVWIGFEDADPIDLLKAEVDKALESCGFIADRKPFRAHLTLGRIRALKDLQEYNRVIDSMKDHFSGDILADRLVFYKSEAGFKGPLYSILEEVLFRDQPF